MGSSNDNSAKPREGLNPSSVPFFIVGCTRSGTTLVSRILDSHSRLAVYHESHFYHLLRHDLHRYGNLEQSSNLRRFLADVREVLRRQRKMTVPTEEEFLAALSESTFAGALAALLTLYAQQQGKSRGGDKTPGHHSYLAEITEQLPQSPLIFLLRDPRDTVVAIHEKFGTSLKGATALWNAAYLSYTKFPGRVHLIPYEALVRRPTESVQALCTYLGEDYEPGMMRFFEHIPDRLARIKYNQDLLTPIDPSHIGRFREMSKSEITRVEAACGIGMEALGYKFSGTKPKVLPIKEPTRLEFIIDRLRFYGWNRYRWRRGWIRWKVVLRLRLKYFLSLEWLRG
jgi:hypothetical protein